jgi:hypothetical protein
MAPAKVRSSRPQHPSPARASGSLGCRELQVTELPRFPFCVEPALGWPGRGRASGPRRISLAEPGSRNPVAEEDRRCDNPWVLVEGHLYGDRVWFRDTRSPVRRMGITTHAVDATIVISLWQGDVCTGTFRLPAKDAAGVISTLAHGMTEAIPDSDHGSGGGPTPTGSSWSRLFRRLFAHRPAMTDTHLRLLE